MLADVVGRLACEELLEPTKSIRSSNYRKKAIEAYSTFVNEAMERCMILDEYHLKATVAAGHLLGCNMFKQHPDLVRS